MKVAKRFRWEAAHRLPWHKGGCENLHGHSYRMLVELMGPTNDQGMVVDFKDVKSIVKPLVDAWDHATLVADYDVGLLEAIQLLGSKHFVFPYDTTSENLCRYVCDHFGEHAMSMFMDLGITLVSVRVEETETCYAELLQEVSQLAETSVPKNGSALLANPA